MPRALKTCPFFSRTTLLSQLQSAFSQLQTYITLDNPVTVTKSFYAKS